MGILFTITIGILFTIVPGIQFTISKIAPSVWMSLPVADGSGTHGIDGPGVLIADRHIELVCTYGGSDIYQPLGVIKCDHIIKSEHPDLTNFEKIITIITANLGSITTQVIAHSHTECGTSQVLVTV